jgi:two-component system, sensor histidine kinase LadS
MKNKTTNLTSSQCLWIIVFLFLTSYCATAQYSLDSSNKSEEISIHTFSEYFDSGKKQLSKEEIRTGNYKFKPIPNKSTDFGFTSNHYWIKFQLKNTSETDLDYFFETARPITDLAELYVIDKK